MSSPSVQGKTGLDQLQNSSDEGDDINVEGKIGLVSQIKRKFSIEKASPDSSSKTKSSVPALNIKGALHFSSHQAPAAPLTVTSPRKLPPVAIPLSAREVRDFQDAKKLHQSQFKAKPRGEAYINAEKVEEWRKKREPEASGDQSKEKSPPRTVNRASTLPDFGRPLQPERKRKLPKLSTEEAKLYSKITFTTLVPNYAKWERKILKDFEDFVLKRIQQRKLRTKNVSKFISYHVLCKTPIPARLEEALSQVKSSAFLNKLRKIKDAEAFIIQCSLLERFEKEAIFKIIGGPQVFALLEKFVSKKEELEKISTQILHIYETIPHLATKVLCDPPEFDQEFPIAKINADDVVRSLSRFWTEECDEPVITLNREKYYRPKFENGLLEMNRRKKFLVWFIGLLNDSFGKFSKSRLKVEEQADLLYWGPIDQEKQAIITKGVVKLFAVCKSKEIPITREMVVREISKVKSPKGFLSWVEKNYSRIVEEGAQENPIYSIITEFNAEKRAYLCPRYIPCWQLLQLITFNAFREAGLKMKKHSPRLFPEDANELHLKKFSEDLTQFEIEVKPDNTFQVVQCNKFQIISGKDHPHFNFFGSIFVYWTVHGRQKSDKYSANLHYDKLAFSEDLPLEMQLQILELLPKLTL